MLLPLTYEGEGVMKSHLHTRSYASLFDLSFRQQYRYASQDFKTHELDFFSFHA